MRVNNVYLTNVKLPQAEDATQTLGDAKRSESEKKAEPEVSAHVPSPELLQLLDLVQGAPEVRQERIENVRQRLEAGEYSTPEAAQKTAEVMLRSNE